MDVIRTAEGVVDALGGQGAAAETLRLKPSAVGNWKLRNRIPPEHFLNVTAALKAIGKEAAPEVFGMAQREAAE